MTVMLTGSWEEVGGGQLMSAEVVTIYIHDVVNFAPVGGGGGGGGELA